LVEEILKHWPGRWDDRSGQASLHEASLLNLSTDKAFRILGWSARWGFEETVEATVSWYRNILGRDSGNACELVRGQISRYVE
jgi:CDP-glucose 4,6-dehydratase